MVTAQPFRLRGPVSPMAAAQLNGTIHSNLPCMLARPRIPFEPDAPVRTICGTSNVFLALVVAVQ